MQAGPQALMDASRFDEFKTAGMATSCMTSRNLASRLSLLRRQMPKSTGPDNPQFRADMLVNIAQIPPKNFRACWPRLGRYGQGQVHDLKPIDLAELGPAALPSTIPRRSSRLR